MGRGGSIFLDAEVGLKIMRNSEEIRAAALVKNQRRRVTVAGGEVRDAGNLKRGRRAATVTASQPDDGKFLTLRLCPRLV